MYRKKILILPSWYPSKEKPLFGIFFKEQATELNKKMDVSVLYIEEPIKIIELSKLFEKKIDFSYENSIFTVRYKYINWFPHCEFLKLWLYRRAVIRGYNLIKIHFGIPDVLHAHSILMGGYGAIILKERFHIPVIVTEHVSFLSKFFSSSRKLIAYEVLYHADKFTAVSTYLANLINEIGRDQCEIIPNFIPKCKFFVPSYPQLDITKFRILNVSNLILIKGIDILINALDLVIHKYCIVNCLLEIVGEGPDREELESKVKLLSLENYCVFHGEMNPDELSNIYLKTNALVISSRSETFGIVGIEAMSLGKPIISTRCGGPEEYVTPDVGYLVENENPEKLAEGIIYVMNNYQKYSPQKIRETFLSNYSSDVVIEKWIKVYSDLMIKK